MLRWGIVSTGVIAKKFAETLTELGKKGNDVTLTAVVSRNEDKAKAFATEHNAKSFYCNYEDFLNDDNIDIVYIATPNKFHFENAMMCLNAGKHVLCEKPFTTNAKDAQTLYETARNKGLFIMDGLWTLHLPMYHKIKQLLNDGAIGEVRHVRAEFGFITQGARKDMKLDPSLGGGALLDVGIYTIAFAALAFGVNPTGIKANLNISEYGTDDLSTVILEYKDGKSAALSSSIGVTMPKEGVIFGTKGLIRLPNFHMAEDMTLSVESEEDVEVKMPFEVNGFEYQITESARCIKSNKNTHEVLDEAFSVGVIKILDDIRKQCGLTFSFE